MQEQNVGQKLRYDFRSSGVDLRVHDTVRHDVMFSPWYCHAADLRFDGDFRIELRAPRTRGMVREAVCTRATRRRGFRPKAGFPNPPGRERARRAGSCSMLRSSERMRIWAWNHLDAKSHTMTSEYARGDAWLRGQAGSPSGLWAGRSRFRLERMRAASIDGREPRRTALRYPLAKLSGRNRVGGQRLPSQGHFAMGGKLISTAFGSCPVSSPNRVPRS